MNTKSLPKSYLPLLIIKPCLQRMVRHLECFRVMYGDAVYRKTHILMDKWREMEGIMLPKYVWLQCGQSFSGTCITIRTALICKGKFVTQAQEVRLCQSFPLFYVKSQTHPDTQEDLNKTLMNSEWMNEWMRLSSSSENSPRINLI